MNTTTVLIAAFVIGLLAYPVAIYAKSRREAAQAALYCPDCGAGLACCVHCQQELCATCSPCGCKPPKTQLRAERMASLRQPKSLPPAADDFFRIDLNATKTVRILPPASERVFTVYGRTDKIGTVSRSAKQHYLDNKGVQCIEQSCPICDYYKELWNEADQIEDLVKREKIVREARQIKPVDRYYYNVLDRSTGEVKIWAVGKTVQNQLQQLAGDFTDVDQGYDLLVRKESVSHFFRYQIIPKPSSPLADSLEQMEEIVSQQWDLEELVRSWFKTSEDLQKFLDDYRRKSMPICESCLQPFSKTFAGQKYCSPECWKAANDPDYFKGRYKTCGFCGKLFSPLSVDAIYCNHQCGRLAEINKTVGAFK